MSTNEQTLLSQPTSILRNTLGKELVSQDPGMPISDEVLREYYERNYHKILPIIAEKVHQEKEHQSEEGVSKKGSDQDDSRRWSHYSSRRDTKSCHQSSRSRATESASDIRYNKRASSRTTEELSESEGSVGGHWKSKLKRQKLSIEDDLSQP
ncbi:hypothetical protein Tco_1171234 [Tanacetum coccineum]